MGGFTRHFPYNSIFGRSFATSEFAVCLKYSVLGLSFVSPRHCSAPAPSGGFLGLNNRGLEDERENLCERTHLRYSLSCLAPVPQ